jgi:enamine deaminase RidA (YjgF/YER057c/UK114 family)
VIKRLPGAFPTRCRAVVHNGIVSLVAIATTSGMSMYEETVSALQQVDATLTEAGSSKAKILTALVFVTDMAQKEEMNRAWDEWADRANPPMRACVSAGLTGSCQIEIVVTAVAG